MSSANCRSGRAATTKPKPSDTPARRALKTTEAGVSLVISIKYPEPATQRATLVVRMPKALAVRIQPSRSTLEIADVAAVDLAEWRGEAVVRRISGRVTAIHRGGTLTVEGVGALKLNTRGSTVVLKDVKGEADDAGAGGRAVSGQSLAGPVEIELNGTRLMLEDLTTTRRPIRINAIGGSVTLGGIRTETGSTAATRGLTSQSTSPPPSRSTAKRKNRWT